MYTLGIVMMLIGAGMLLYILIDLVRTRRRGSTYKSPSYHLPPDQDIWDQEYLSAPSAHTPHKYKDLTKGWPPMVKPFPPPPPPERRREERVNFDEPAGAWIMPAMMSSSADPGPAPEPRQESFTGFEGGHSGGAGASGSWDSSPSCDSGSSSSDSGSSSCDSGSSGGSSD